MWYPGKITNIIDDKYVVSRMEYLNKRQTNKFCQPTPEIEKPYDRQDLLYKLDDPVSVSLGKRQGYYTFLESDFNDASQVLAIVLR